MAIGAETEGLLEQRHGLLEAREPDERRTAQREGACSRVAVEALEADRLVGGLAEQRGALLVLGAGEQRDREEVAGGRVAVGDSAEVVVGASGEAVAVAVAQLVEAGDELVEVGSGFGEPVEVDRLRAAARGVGVEVGLRDRAEVGAVAGADDDLVEVGRGAVECALIGEERGAPETARQVVGVELDEAVEHGEALGALGERLKESFARLTLEGEERGQAGLEVGAFLGARVGGVARPQRHDGDGEEDGEGRGGDGDGLGRSAADAAELARERRERTRGDRPVREEGAEIGFEGGDRRVAATWVALHALLDDRAEVAREVGPDPGGGIGILGAELRDHLHGIAVERRAAGDEVVESGAQAVDVDRGGRALVSLGLLGGHVPRRAERGIAGGERRIAGAGGDAEVEEDGVEVTADDDVRRLDVAMEHVARVRCAETGGDVCTPAHDRAEPGGLRGRRVGAAHRFVEPTGKGGVGRGIVLGAREERGERDAGEAFHDEEQRAVLALTAVVDADDMLVLERGEGLGFATEALAGVAAGTAERLEQLDRDLALELEVGAGPDHAHRAAAKARVEAVAAGEDATGGGVRVVGGPQHRDVVAEAEDLADHGEEVGTLAAKIAGIELLPALARLERPAHVFDEEIFVVLNVFFRHRSDLRPRV